jgi:hypothetical protein
MRFSRVVVGTSELLDQLPILHANQIMTYQAFIGGPTPVKDFDLTDFVMICNTCCLNRRNQTQTLTRHSTTAKTIVKNLRERKFKISSKGHAPE